jgi:hypothetical protein
MNMETTNEQPGTAPKLTPEHVAAQVASVAYHRFEGTTVTVCCITLRNGYNTIGHSACVSPENFDATVGEQIAYKNALNEIWQLEGYLLAEVLHMQRSQDSFVQNIRPVGPTDTVDNMDTRSTAIEYPPEPIVGDQPVGETDGSGI